MIRNTNCLLSVDCPFTLFNKDFHFELIDNGLKFQSWDCN